MRYLVVGGGIAGVCCTEELARNCPDDLITLVSASDTLKGVRNVIQLTKNIEELEIESKSLMDLSYPNVRVLQGVASALCLRSNELCLSDGRRVPFDKVCVCTGARPRLVSDHPHVLTLRDTESIQELQHRLQLPSCRRVVIVGNGGIALELVAVLQGVEVVWAVKHGHIGDAFFDRDAAQFLLEEVQLQRSPQCAAPPSAVKSPIVFTNAPAPPPAALSAVHRNAPESARGQGDPSSSASAIPETLTSGHGARKATSEAPYGHAVGPRWAETIQDRAAAALGGSLTVETGVDVRRIEAGNDGWPVQAVLSNGKTYGADLIISAIGVQPATDWLPPSIHRADDGGILINATCQSSVAHVYAAGDACTVQPGCQAPHWFQMRLWTQARILGAFAAQCMCGVADELALGFNLELFTHVTRFCGKKVIFLGLYNGQKLDKERAEDIALYSRVLEGEGGGEGGHAGCCRPGASRKQPEAIRAEDALRERTFVRVLMLRGRMQGAVLIGDTDLEEAFENLILDGLDLSRYGPAILDPDFEVDHVFD